MISQYKIFKSDLMILSLLGLGGASFVSLTELLNIAFRMCRLRIICYPNMTMHWLMHGKHIVHRMFS